MGYTPQPSENKEVYFNEYCDSCKHNGLPDTEDPCNWCLTNTTNLYSHKPVNYEEGDKKCQKSDSLHSDSVSELP